MTSSKPVLVRKIEESIFILVEQPKIRKKIQKLGVALLQLASLQTFLDFFNDSHHVSKIIQELFLNEELSTSL